MKVSIYEITCEGGGGRPVYLLSANGNGGLQIEDFTLQIGDGGRETEPAGTQSIAALWAQIV